VKSEKIVLRGIGGEIQKADLIPDSETNARVFDLAKGQTRFLQ
jgi:hypothetical protein